MSLEYTFPLSLTVLTRIVACENLIEDIVGIKSQEFHKFIAFTIWDTEPVFSHSTQQIIITNNSTKTVTDELHKNSDLVKLIFIDGSSSDFLEMILPVFQNLFLRTDTLAFFLNVDAYLQDTGIYETFQYLRYTPSLRFIIKISKFPNNTKKYKISLLHNYSSLNGKIFSENVMHNMLKSKANILRVHKLYFWNLQNERIPVYIPWTLQLFYKETISKAFTCDYIFKSKCYNLLQKASHCWGKQMVGSELSKTHNITYRIAHIDHNLWSPFPEPFVQFDVLSNLKSEWSEGSYLQYYSGFIPFYYVDTNHYRNQTSEIAYDVWIKPFSPVLWCLLIITWILCSMFFTFTSKLKSNLWDVFPISFIQTFHILDRNRSVIKCVVVFAGFFLSESYSNEITSELTVEDKIQPFEDIETFIAAEYCLYDPRFSTRNKGYVNSTYYCDDYLRLADYEYGFVKEKIGKLVQSRWKDWYMHTENAVYKQRFGENIECLIVNEEIGSVPWFLVIYTVNRYWMMKTVQYLHESGLVGRWNNWAQYFERIQMPETFAIPNPEEKSDKIGILELNPVWIFSGAVLALSGVIFITESIISCWKNADARWSAKANTFMTNVYNILSYLILVNLVYLPRQRLRSFSTWISTFLTKYKLRI